MFDDVDEVGRQFQLPKTERRELRVTTVDSLTLVRIGHLRFRVDGDKHCGAKSAVNADGTMSARYTARLVVVAPGYGITHNLDDNGFLVDQEGLHEMLQGEVTARAPVEHSCEELTLVLGHALRKWLFTSNPRLDIEELEFSLSPTPNLGTFTVKF